MTATEGSNSERYKHNQGNIEALFMYRNSGHVSGDGFCEILGCTESVEKYTRVIVIMDI